MQPTAKRLGWLSLSSLLFLSCSSENEQVPEGTTTKLSQTSGLQDRGREPSQPAANPPTSDFARQVQSRTEALRGLDKAERIRDIKEGLQRDDRLELATLGNWKGDLDAQAVESILLAHFTDIGWERALSQFELIENNLALSAPILSRILEGVSQHHPEKAKQWLANNPKAPGASSAAVTVGKALAKTESHVTAFDSIWNSRLPDELRSNMLNGFVNEWMSQEFDAPFRHLSSMDPDPLLDRTIYDLVGMSAPINAADTMTWAESITNEGLRRSAIVETARNWAVENKPAYVRWKESQAPADLLDSLP